MLIWVLMGAARRVVGCHWKWSAGQNLKPIHPEEMVLNNYPKDDPPKKPKIASFLPVFGPNNHIHSDTLFFKLYPTGLYLSIKEL